MGRRGFTPPDGRPVALEDCPAWPKLLARLQAMEAADDPDEWDRIKKQAYQYHAKVRLFCKTHGVYAILPVIPTLGEKFGTLVEPLRSKAPPKEKPAAGPKAPHPSKGTKLSPEERARRGAKKKRVQLRHAKHDWVRANHLYVRGEPGLDPDSPRKWYSLREVAEMIGASEGSVCARSAEEDWTGQRAAFQRKLQEAENARLIEVLASQRAKAAVQCFGTAMKGVRAVDRKLTSDENSASDLSKLGSGLRSFQSVAQVATGLPADGPQNVVVLDWTALRSRENDAVRGKVVEALGSEEWGDDDT